MADLTRGAEYGVYLPCEIAGEHNPDEILRQMLDHGSRYNNLGKHLGRGIVIVLGTELLESIWTKMLPKSETKPLFKTFIRNAHQCEVAYLARQYTPLCHALLDWYLRHLAYSASSFNHPTADTTAMIDDSSPPISSAIQYEPLPFTYALDASLFESQRGFTFIEGFEANPDVGSGY